MLVIELPSTLVGSPWRGVSAPIGTGRAAMERVTSMTCAQDPAEHPPIRGARTSVPLASVVAEHRRRTFKSAISTGPSTESAATTQMNVGDDFLA